MSIELFKGVPLSLWEERNQSELASGRKVKYTSPSGFDLRAVYTPVDLEELGWDYLKDEGLPGEYPYTRGQNAAGYRKHFWNFEFYAGFGSAEEARRRYQFLIVKFIDISPAFKAKMADKGHGC